MPLNQIEAFIIKICGYHRWRIKIIFLWILDLSLVFFTLPLAIFVRLDFQLPSNYAGLILTNYLLVCAISYSVGFFFFRTHSTIIRLANLNTAIRISAASSIGAILFFIITNQLLGLPPIPRSVYLIQMLLFIPLATLPRFSFRIMEKILKFYDSGIPTLIYGAGRTTNIFLPALLKPASGIKVIGLVDDDRNKRRSEVQGVSVLGTGRDLEDLVSKHSIQQIIICMPTLDGLILRQLVTRLRALSVTVKIAPEANEFINNRKSPDRVELRDIDIEDLLRRPPRKVDQQKIEHMIVGQSIMVTGGGGSIGSELCRQICGMKPKVLVINDSSEYNLYSIYEELREKFPDQKIIPALADLSQEQRCVNIFHTHSIDIVFHAAAYKHVPLVEENVSFAVQNNLGCTVNLFKACWHHRVKRVIFISSDKAVRPTNVMGATKRLGELIGLWYGQQQGDTLFSTVRFGNVLGSSGSVIPKFLKQIKEGGPVTVTDPEITRYFMLIPEAVSLVLQAAQSSQSGEIYVLDMGKPVKILDLARDLISITGMKEDVDIQIKFTGLRNGEKMFEELYLGNEELERISADFYRVASLNTIQSDIFQQIESMFFAAQKNETSKVRDILFSIIQRYEKMNDRETMQSQMTPAKDVFRSGEKSIFHKSAEVGV